MCAGCFTIYMPALLLLYEPVKRLTGIHNIFEQAIGASQKVFEVLDRGEEIHEKPDAPLLDRFRDSIVFNDVSFRYPSSPRAFELRSIALEIKAAAILALVRPRAPSKTTSVTLL